MQKFQVTHGNPMIILAVSNLMTFEKIKILQKHALNEFHIHKSHTSCLAGTPQLFPATHYQRHSEQSQSLTAPLTCIHI